MFAFAPLQKRAMGTAVGIAAAIIVFVGTAIPLLRRGEQHIPLDRLQAYFRGYSESWRGAVMGAAIVAAGALALATYRIVRLEPAAVLRRS